MILWSNATFWDHKATNILVLFLLFFNDEKYDLDIPSWHVVWSFTHLTYKQEALIVKLVTHIRWIMIMKVQDCDIVVA